MNPLAFLHARRSVPSRNLSEPGPSPHELEALLAVAIRVPDHAKLNPFRLLLIRGGARIALGEKLASIHRAHEPDAPQAAVDKDRARFTFAPLIVAVIARITDDHPKAPAQEQLLSAGCVAYNLLLGAQALGYGAQWLTGWAAYDHDAAAVFGLTANERIISFVHIGTAMKPAPDSPRPSLDEIVSELRLPA